MGSELNVWIVFQKPIQDIALKAQTIAVKIVAGEAKPYEYILFDKLAERQQLLEGKLAAYEQFCQQTGRGK